MYALAVHHARMPEHVFDHDFTSGYLTTDAARNRCSSLGRIRGERSSLTLTKATLPPSTSQRNCRSEIPRNRAAWANVTRDSKPSLIASGKGTRGGGRRSGLRIGLVKGSDSRVLEAVGQTSNSSWAGGEGFIVPYFFASWFATSTASV